NRPRPPLRVSLRFVVHCAALVFAALALAAPPASAAEAGGATLSGTVSNAATGNLLAGAQVEIPALGLAAITDQTGRFVLAGVPAGEHEVTASYTGLDTGRQAVRVGGGAPAPVAFTLTSSIYKLDKFTAFGPREGNAAAITEQR